MADYESRLTAQKDEYELLLGRRDREHEEGGNLLTMLRTDLDRLQGERYVTWLGRGTSMDGEGMFGGVSTLCDIHTQMQFIDSMPMRSTYYMLPHRTAFCTRTAFFRIFAKRTAFVLLLDKKGQLYCF